MVLTVLIEIDCQKNKEQGTFMVNGLHFYSSFLTSGHSKLFTISHCNTIHPFMHTFTHRWRSQPCNATASSPGAVRVRCFAQGHLNTRLGGAGDRPSNLPVTSHPALPKAHAALYNSWLLCYQHNKPQYFNANTTVVICSTLINMHGNCTHTHTHTHT